MKAEITPSGSVPISIVGAAVAVGVGVLVGTGVDVAVGKTDVDVGGIGVGLATGVAVGSGVAVGTGVGVARTMPLGPVGAGTGRRSAPQAPDVAAGESVRQSHPADGHWLSNSA